MAMTRSANSPQDTRPRDTALEGVVLIHGLGRSHLAMEVMALRLRADRFTVECVGYHSRGLSLRNATDAVERQVTRLARGWDVVHLAGHSLGGVIAAAIAAKRTRLPVGRVVVIGAPMCGSPLAGLCTRVAPVKEFLGPVLEELAEGEALIASSPQIGAIAGTGGNRYIGRRIGFTSPYDGKVSVRSAWTGAAHRAAVPVSHAMLPFSRQVADLTAAFLRHGRFPTGMERAA
jgi:pimeloyl-ACP methyl ester carboxylesterase